MNKQINGKSNQNKKNVIRILIIFIFLFFFISVITISNRKYFLIERVAKNISSKINKYIVKNLYSNDISDNNSFFSKIRQLEDENNELKRIVDLKEKNTNYMAEVVVNRGNYNWYKKLDITNNNKYTQINLPVINSYGLVGFTDKISKNMAEVNLLTNVNNNSLISVIIKTSDNEISGVLREYDYKKKLFKVTDIIDKNEIKDGDEVILSGYQNNYKGIYIGYVVNQNISDYGLTKTVWVKSKVNFDNIMYVMVVGEK